MPPDCHVFQSISGVSTQRSLLPNYSGIRQVDSEKKNYKDGRQGTEIDQNRSL